MDEYLKKRLEMLPESPGVYMYSDKYKNIIYVGKAKVLKNRVRQYFQKSGLPIKTVKLVENIADINWIVTDSEVEALMLECNLIKQYRPYFNILLKDDKSFPYLKLTTNEEYPRLELTRKREMKKGKYYGPYTNAWYAKKTMEAINRVYPIKMCNKTISYGLTTGKVCLNYHIGQCCGACQGNIPKEEYDKWVNEVDSILSGDPRTLVNKLEQEMMTEADKLNFETAQYIKELIECVNGLFEKQKISTSTDEERDVIGIYSSEKQSCIQIFCVRDGKIAKTELRYMKNTESDTTEEILLNFLQQYYSSGAYIPAEILVKDLPEDSEILSRFLSEMRGGKCIIKTARKGDKKKLIDLATKNARMNIQLKETIESDRKEKENNALVEIQSMLSMDKIPYRIESYDISNIMGTDNVGVEVVFNNGKKAPKDYRRFRIKYVDGQDDYASMTEVVFRRLNRAKEELENGLPSPRFLPMPDLILVDGGLTHVHTVESVTEDFSDKIKVAGLVKDNKHRLRGLMLDDGNEIPVSSLVYSKKLLNDISEEVHRYAIEYHRTSRSRSMLTTELEGIAGIGPKRCNELLKDFGSVKAIAAASIEELSKVPGMNRAAAENVYYHFNGTQVSDSDN